MKQPLVDDDKKNGRGWMSFFCCVGKDDADDATARPPHSAYTDVNVNSVYDEPSLAEQAVADRLRTISSAQQQFYRGRATSAAIPVPDQKKGTKSASGAPDSSYRPVVATPPSL
jgi:hypothetical protein